QTERFDELVDVRVERRVVAAGAGGDPAAERGELERLREVAQREPVRPELFLERGAEDARLDAGGARGAVHLQHAVEPGEVERERAAIPGPDVRLDAAHHARTTAVWNGGD